MISVSSHAAGPVVPVRSIWEWEGEFVVTHRDRPTGCLIFIAVHDSRLGPATGGTRLMRYASPEDALADAQRLARGMTLKFAVPRFPCGGGKAVIAVPGELAPAERRGLLLRYGELIARLGGLFRTGPDVGTTTADMDVIAETGAPHVFSRSPARGGAGDSSGFTALGVFHGIMTTLAKLGVAPAGAKVAVQGLGNVGRKLVAHLRTAGLQVVCTDVDPAAARPFAADRAVSFVPPDDFLSVPCDVLAPCALGGVLDADTVPRLRCRAVVGAANNQLAVPEAADWLRARGVLYAPDFVVNIGGALGITGREAFGWSEAEATREVEKIGPTLAEVYATATAEGITPLAAAHRVAERNLSSHSTRHP